MFNFNEFAKEIMDNIKNFLPEEYENATVELNDVQKLNQTYPALIVRKPDQLITPSINMKEVFRAYERDGDIANVLTNLAVLVTSQPEGLNMEQYTNYEIAKNNLFIRVSGLENNKEILANAPHTVVDNLAITYHLMAGMADGCVGSTLINNQLMESLGITKEQLHADALANSEKILQPEVQPMTKMLGRMMGIEVDTPPSEKNFDEMLKEVDFSREDMYVLTNSESVNGAAVIFYPDVLEKIGEHAGGDFFVLPSSVHETLILPDNGLLSYKELETTVREINRNELKENERLSDSVYHYDCREHVFERAEVFEERSKEMDRNGMTVKDRLLKEARAQVEAQIGGSEHKEKDQEIE